MSFVSEAKVRAMVANPNGNDFQSRYLPLGRSQGKKQLQADCKKFGIRITVKAFQIIENGYSHRQRVTYANDITRCDYDCGRLSDTSGGIGKRVHKGRKEGEIDQFGRTIIKSETEEMKKARLMKEEKEKEAILQRKKEEHARKIEEKKEKKIKKLVTTLAKLDSWEDF